MFKKNIIVTPISHHLNLIVIKYLLYYLSTPLLFLILSQLDYIEKQSPDIMFFYQFIHQSVQGIKH